MERRLIHLSNKEEIDYKANREEIQMDRIDYQNEISETLDKALNDLDTEDFDILIQRVKEMVEDYN